MFQLGVSSTPCAIQKPPYDDSAVAPNVLPTAISLASEASQHGTLEPPTPNQVPGEAKNSPHAGQELHEAAVSERERHRNVGRGDARGPAG